MSAEWTTFLSVLAQSGIALLALLFIGFQIARERWISKPMRKLVAVQTLIEFLVPSFFAFVALLPVQQVAMGNLQLAGWQLGGMLAGIVGVFTAAFITRHGIQNRRKLDSFGQNQLRLQWMAFGEYTLILLFAAIGSLVGVSIMMVWLLMSGSIETWLFFAELD